MTSSIKSSFLPFRRLQSDTPDLVAGPLKLATKYHVDGMRNRIVSHLKEDWPTSLAEWDSIAYVTNEIEGDDSDDESSLTETPTETQTENPNHLSIQNFCRNPVPFIQLARECDLPDVLATIFYSVGCESSTRKEILFNMAQGDLQTLILGRERMMTFICDQGAHDLVIDSWAPDISIDEWITQPACMNVFCRSKHCHYLVLKKWLDILQPIMRYGNPLATLRMEMRKLRQQDAEDHYSGDYYDSEYPSSLRRDICTYCKDKLADGLKDLRRTLFDRLPFFFGLKQDDPPLAPEEEEDEEEDEDEDEE